MKKIKYIIAASLLLVLGIAVEHQHTHNSSKKLAVADVHVDTHFNLQELTTLRSGNNDPKTVVYSSYGSIGVFTLTGTLK